MSKAILFDFDGTLADTLEFYVQAYDFALQKFGVIWDQKQIVQNCFGKKEDEICDKLGLPEKVEEFRKNYFDGIKTLFVKANLFECTKNILDLVKNKGYKVGVITYAYRWYIDIMLKQYNLENYFEYVISADDVSKTKPDPEAVLLMCKKLDIEPKDTFVIGDSKSDILMGKAAGSKTILIMPEKYSSFIDQESILVKSNPDFVIKSLDEIKEII